MKKHSKDRLSSASPLYNVILVMGLTVVLKGIGFINRAVIAYFFGTTDLTDSYYIASGFVEGLAAVLLSGVSVGIINNYLRNDADDDDAFVSHAAVAIVLASAAVSAMCFFGKDPIARLLAIGSSEEQIASISGLLAFMVGILPLQGLIVVFSATLEAEKKFVPVKVTGTITSLTSIACIVVLAGDFGITALTISFVAGYVLNAIFLFFCVKPYIKLNMKGFLSDRRLLNLVLTAAPLIIGMLAHQLNLIIDKSIASTIQEGAVSALAYSTVLYLFVENVVISSTVTVIFPSMSEKKISNQHGEIEGMGRKAILLAEAVLIPIVLITCFNSEAITSIVYFRGQFDEMSLVLTSAALCGYVLGLPFLVIRDVATRAFYAYEDTITPVVVNVVAVIANVIMDVLLGRLIGVAGIALATSLANLLSGIWMAYAVKKHGINLIVRNSISEIKPVLASMLIAAVLCMFFTRAFNGVAAFVMCCLTVFPIEVLVLKYSKSSIWITLSKMISSMRKG